jgi:hypothetical protein
MRTNDPDRGRKRKRRRKMKEEVQSMKDCRETRRWKSEETRRVTEWLF